jgi:hypothetical protein
LPSDSTDLQLLVTVHFKTLFGYSRDGQDRLIKFAEPRPGAHTEETPEDIEETELVEAWDLNASAYAPTERLADNEEEDDGYE